jgi:hypothetical protein
MTASGASRVVKELLWRGTRAPCNGAVGILELFRDPTHIPYRITRSLAHISVGDVYVRHGSHVEPPTTAERADLDAEGRAARGQTPTTT